jgi:nucleotide-binding universal stress UspA family protein
VTNDQAHPQIVVGYDGRWQNRTVLTAAAREARWHGLPLTVVTVLRSHGGLGDGPRGPHPDDAVSGRAARRRNREAVDELARLSPDVLVRGHCIDEEDVRAGEPPMSSAALLVVGARGQYEQPALQRYSISDILFRAAHCPVLAVPDTRSPHRPTRARPVVLAGISEHPTDLAVARAAMAEAVRRGGDLHLVQSAADYAGEHPSEPQPLHPGLVTHLALPAGAPMPTISVFRTAEPPLPALRRHAAAATVLVVGGRAGALRGLVRDSVTRELLQDPPCPVLAIPRDLGDRPELDVSAADAGSSHRVPAGPAPASPRS